MKALRVAVAGNPNVGKTSLFNLLTGSRYKVGNYPGVTVETREGGLRVEGSAVEGVRLVDLPGTYSLTPMAEDEAVAFRALTGADVEAPELVLLVLDATNLGRNLYLALQIFELGLPVVVVLNMVDLAKDAGVGVDASALEAALGLPVVETVARTGEGVPELAARLKSMAGQVEPMEQRLVPAPEGGMLAGCLADMGGDGPRQRWLLAGRAADRLELAAPSEVERQRVEGLDEEAVREAMAELVGARYAEVDRLLEGLGLGADAAESRDANVAPAMATSEKVDAVLTHRVFGPLIFVAVMALVFQSIFSWADPFMGVIEGGVGWLSEAARSILGPGLFTDLVTEGVIAGVGNVVVFVPQIALLFLFIGLLEDSGYMARAAFIVDRLMARVGLNGKAFVPLLSGYACAIPAIMSTRTIASFKDRVVAILMIPFVSCSARLPVYTLIIGTLFVADERVFGPFTQGGLILLAMYGLSTVSALVLGAVYKRTLLKSPTPPLVLELPPYRLPRIRDTLRHVWDRTLDFLRDAGTIILAVTIVLWGLLTFPRVDPSELSEGETAIERSVAGTVGKAMEPALEPIGQDWRIGVALIGSFAAREVLVSTLGLVYDIEGADEDDAPLRDAMREAKDPDTGEPRYSPLSGLALMVFFVYACQCMSTLAVVRRETGGWKWPIFMLVSMTVIAYVAALIVYQGGQLLGFG